MSLSHPLYNDANRRQPNTAVVRGFSGSEVQAPPFDLAHWQNINRVTKHIEHYKRQIKATVK